MISRNGSFHIQPRKLAEILKKNIEDTCDGKGVKAEVSIVTRILA